MDGVPTVFCYNLQTNNFDKIALTQNKADSIIWTINFRVFSTVLQLELKEKKKSPNINRTDSELQCY